ncbi:MAG: serine/threonine protein kinase [Burkholderiales bacterium]
MPPQSGGRPAVVPASAGTTPRSAPLPVGVHLRHFEITGHLGEGGFGIVYIARDDHLHRMVAIKEYMPSSLAWRLGDNTIAPISEQHRATFEADLSSFRKEARLLAHFDHPGLVKVYEYWDANGTAYMVTPFYEGTTLKQYRRDLAAPPTEEWLKKLLQLLMGALQAMHNEHCMHRDISPDNILIRPNGVPVLLDFGAARRVINNMAQALTVILKPGYAPVEQYAQGSTNEQGPWTDVYALAAVVYFAITGKAPLPSVARIISDTLSPLSKIAAGQYSDSFLAGLDKALSVRPEQRPQNMHELAAVLGLEDSEHKTAVPAPTTLSTPTLGRTAQQTQQVQQVAHTPTLPSASEVVPAARPARTRLWLLGGIICSVAAVLLFVVMRPTQNSSKPPAPDLVAPAPANVQPAQSDPAPSPPVDERTTVSSPASPPEPGPAANELPSVSSAPAEPSAAPPPAPVHEPAKRSTPTARQHPKPVAPPPVQSASRAQVSKMQPARETRSKASSGTRSARCSDVLSRLQIGEAISSEEQALFQKECQR